MADHGALVVGYEFDELELVGVLRCPGGAHDAEFLAGVAVPVGEGGSHDREDALLVFGTHCDANDGHGRCTPAVTK